MSLNISNFDELVRVARTQPEPQRLLFVFAVAEMPDDATPGQRADFEAGRGGALLPLMSVDKRPEDIISFAALAEESRQYASQWDIVFVAALAGKVGGEPTADEADRSMQQMIESIRSGKFGAYLPFDARSEPVLFG